MDYIQHVNPTGYARIYAEVMANIPAKVYNTGTSHFWGGRRQLDYVSTKFAQSAPTTTYTTRTPESIMKRGGRIRPVDEQHYLDQQKEITKAINALDQNIIKLLFKMLK